MAISDLSNIVSKQKQREGKDKKASFAFDRILNGFGTILDNTKRVRQGKFQLPQYVEKAGGYADIVTISGAAGGGRGGLMYVHPDSTVTNRERLIYAMNDQIRLYDVTNDTDTLLRDVDSSDGFSILFLSGVQTKKYAYFVIGDSTMAAEWYRYDGTNLTKETATALNASRLLWKMDDRIMAAGMGDNSATVQYSKLKSTGVFDTFTSSTDTDGAGTLSGSLGSVSAFSYIKGSGVVLERDKITVHTINTIDVSGTGRIKDTKTIVEEQTLSGTGVSSAKSVTDSEDLIYFVSEDNAIFQYDPISRRAENRLIDLTKNFRPNLEGFDFSDSSIIHQAKANRLLVTCSDTAGIGANRVFIYDFDTKIWALDEGKRANQLFYARLSDKVLGLSSSNGEIQELYAGSYQNDGAETTLSAESRMYDFGDRYRTKAFTSFSVEVGATSDVQSFLFEVFVDDGTEPVVSETKSVAELITLSGSTGGVWGSTVWAGGVPGSSALGFVVMFFDDFVPDFQAISVRVSETSSHRSIIGEPVIRFTTTDDKISDFV